MPSRGEVDACALSLSAELAPAGAPLLRPSHTEVEVRQNSDSRMYLPQQYMHFIVA